MKESQNTGLGTSRGTTPAVVDHGITIETVRLPAGTPQRAHCLCGWQSEIVPSRPKAAEVGAVHVTAHSLIVGTTAPPCTRWCCGHLEVSVEGWTQRSLSDSAKLCERGWQVPISGGEWLGDVEVRCVRSARAVVGSPDGAEIGAEMVRLDLDETTFTPAEARAVAATLILAAEKIETVDPAAPSRVSHCSCGRPAREVLAGREFGPTGSCGVPGRPPLDPCDCGRGAARHSRNVCHVYGRGMTQVPSPEQP